MKKYFSVGFFVVLILGGLLISNNVRADVSTVTLVGWDFPDNIADEIADSGISINLSKTIESEGTKTIIYSVDGDSTKSASATGWDLGANTKYWMIEFNSLGYDNLKLSSKSRTSHQFYRTLIIIF